MSLPMQVSIPLALHLRTPVTFDFWTNQRWKPGEKYAQRSVNDFAFIDQQSGRIDASIQFGDILRLLYNHPDWSQIVAFCSKRYSKFEGLGSRSERRKLLPTDDRNFYKKSVIANFNVDLTGAGLPKDFVEKIVSATKESLGSLIGPDPLNCSLGPAISVGLGAGVYMDLMYGGKPPGTYRSLTYKEAKTVATEKKGGQGRSFQEWMELWKVIGDWIYEYESTCIASFGGSYSYKTRLSDEEMRKISSLKVPRDVLLTDAIHGADAMRDMFQQLGPNTTKFHGIEWDFLALEAEKDVEEKFIKRFGPKPVSPTRPEDDMLRIVTPRQGTSKLNYNTVDQSRLRVCPDSYDGLDWDRWLLSIEGGTVVVAKTVFQALWAVMLLTYVPLTITILDKEDVYPKHPNPECVYL